MQFGTPAPASGATFTTIENLAVFETEPVESKLDIFWETTSAGLISDLNSAVANSSSGIVAFFSGFNTSPFNEGIAGGADILATDFRIVDNFGADVTATIDSVSLVSVFNREGTPQNVTSYFTLTDDGSDNYNVITTSTFISNVYYGSNSGQRQFDFTFEVQLTDGGSTTTTTITKEALLTNLSPIIRASDGTSAPNGTLGNLARSTYELLVVTGKNGANSSHSGKDLTWAIISATNSANSPVNYFSISVTNTSSLSTCRLRNNLTQSQTSIPVDDYTIGLRLQDPGGADANLTITVSFGNTVHTVRRRESTYTGNIYNQTDVEFAELFFDEGRSTDGYYLYNGTWEQLTQTADANNVIEVDGTNASTSTTCGVSSWAKGSTGAEALSGLEYCEYDDSLSNNSYGDTVSSTDVNVYRFVID